MVLLCAFAAALGCSLDYEDALVQEDMAETIADVILTNFEHFIVKGGRIVAKIRADRAELYEKKQETILEGVYLQEFGDDGELINEAWADRAVYYSETEDAEVSGEIYLYSYREEAELVAQTLRWDEEGRRLTSDPEEVVHLRSEDGSELTGQGFEADFRNNILRFATGAQGVYTFEDEE